MNAKPVKKWNIPLKLDAVSESVKGNPKAFSESEKYGKTLWVEATEWSDGGLSIGNYNSETKTNFKLGSGKLKEDAPATNNAMQQQSVSNDWNI